MELSYCLNNVDATDRALLEQCEYEPEARLCLQRCGRCAEMPFLVVDGEFRGADSHAAVIDGLSAAPDGENDE